MSIARGTSENRPQAWSRALIGANRVKKCVCVGGGGGGGLEAIQDDNRADQKSIDRG